MSPRKIVDRKGRPESPERISALEAIFYPTERRKSKSLGAKSGEFHYPEDIELLEQVVDEIDFDELRGLFDEIAVHCGIESEDLNFLDRKSIFYVEDLFGQNSASYSPVSNHITLYSIGLVGDSQVFLKHKPNRFLDQEEGEWEKVVDIRRERIKIITLHTLIHEMVHAVSYGKLVTWSETNFLKRLFSFVKKDSELIDYSQIHAGYAKTHKTSKNGDKKDVQHDRNFEVFDEGVTEKITREILKKYLNLFPGFTDDTVRRDFLEIIGKNSSFVDLVDTVIKSIAKKAGMDEEVVWRAVIRSKIEGVNLEDPDLAALIDEHTCNDFTDWLRKAYFIDQKIGELRANLSE